MHRIDDIAAALGARLEGDGSLLVSGPAAPASAGPDQLAMAMDPSYADDLRASKARVAVLGAGMDWHGLGLEAAIYVDRPRYAMAGVTGCFATLPALEGVHPSAVIHPDAVVAADARIGPFVVIGSGSRIGAGARIYSHCSISDNVTIGDNALIAEGVRIRHGATIGEKVIIHPNAVIGSDGFSFVTPRPGSVDAVKSSGHVATDVEDQEYVRIHSLGSVRIGDNVEIGAGSAIDRGTIADTVIGDGCKLDNLVQIGHNVRMGRTCLVCGQVGIGGSAVIGDRVVLGGQVGVADHVTIGANVVAAGKAGISSNVPPNRAIMGNPAVRMETNIASYKAVRRLPRFLTRLEELEKLVSKTTFSR